MLGHLRRLVTTGAAYTASSVISKLVAVFLLPVYTAYLSPTEYGAAEVMIVSVVAASIVVRLGVIEAILRFYYLGGERPGAVVATGFASLLWTATAAAGLALAFAGPISEALLDARDPALARAAILGLWSLTMFEYVLTLLRLDERARAYFAFTVANVAATIPVTVVLLVVAGLGPDGILLGSFGTGAVFLAGRVWAERGRLALVPDLSLLRRMLRFGLPTMPAELTLYSLNFIDRIILVRLAGLAEAGLYALAVKFGQAMNVLARGFHLAWPPLAYSIRDDEEARRTYALIVSWFAALLALAVLALWLLAPYLVDLLAASEYAEAADAVGLVSAGIALYAMYLVLVVVLGRTGRTEFNFPATGLATAANVGLNLALVPPYGIVGAGVALVASYLLVLALMYAFTQRLFPVPYEWGRLALAVGAAVALIALAELFVAESGPGGLALRALLIAAYPPLLLAAGFPTAEERRAIAEAMRPSAVLERLAAARARSPASESGEGERGRGPQLTGEVYETAALDEDQRP